MNTYTDRGEGFAELVEVLTDPETNKRKIPIIVDKLRILVKGQYKGYSVLANGNCCILGHKPFVELHAKWNKRRCTYVHLKNLF